MFSLQLMFKHCMQGTLLHFYFPIAKEVQEVYYFYISLLESILPVTEYSMVQGCSLASSQVHHGQSTWHASIYLNIIFMLALEDPLVLVCHFPSVLSCFCAMKLPHQKMASHSAAKLVVSNPDPCSSIPTMEECKHVLRVRYHKRSKLDQVSPSQATMCLWVLSHNNCHCRRGQQSL